MTLLRPVRRALGLVSILGAVTLVCSADELRQPMYFSAGDLLGQVAHTQNGWAGATLPAGISMQAFLVRRDVVGEVEMHGKAEHFYVAQAGEADVLLGSRLEGSTEISPGDWRGGKIVDGKAYRMKPGDVLWIPPGTAHQIIVPKNGFFQYLGLNAYTKATP